MSKFAFKFFFWGFLMKIYLLVWRSFPMCWLRVFPCSLIWKAPQTHSLRESLSLGSVLMKKVFVRGYFSSPMKTAISFSETSFLFAPTVTIPR